MPYRAKILNASAGSGKTYQLVYKFIRDVIEQPMRYRHILAVTFTNKATEEMKRRIVYQLHLLAEQDEKSDYNSKLQAELRLTPEEVQHRAREVRRRILHDYSRFTVLTIDTFFQRILRAFIKELNLDLNYNIEIETENIMAKSADALIEQIKEDKALLAWITDYVDERLEEGLAWDVRKGILELSKELTSESNPDIGICTKEQLKAIIDEEHRRVRQQQAEIIRLAKEGVRLIEEAGLTVNNFAGKSNSGAGYLYKISRLKSTSLAATLFEPSKTVLNQSESAEDWTTKTVPAKERAAWQQAQALAVQLQPILKEICDLYDQHYRRWNTVALLTKRYRGFALLADLRKKMQEFCKTENLMLLSETKNILSRFVCQNDAPFIYEKVGNRYERFLIDEFQDTSRREWENFLPLLHNAIAQSDDIAVLLVGDIKQSIYRWRGGDWRLLHKEAAERLSDVLPEPLTENRRSLPEIVDFNNRVIEQIVQVDNEAMNRQLDKFSPALREEMQDTLQKAYHDLKQRPCRPVYVDPEPPHHTTAGYISVKEFEAEVSVSASIKELMDKGFKPSDILVLVRNNDMGKQIANELLRFKAENQEERYDFDVMTQEALIIGQSEVNSFIIAALRLALNCDDKIHRALFNRYQGRDFDEPLTPEEVAFFHEIRLCSPEEAFERIVLRYKERCCKTQETAYLQALHEQLVMFCASKVADIPLFLRWWDEKGAKKSLSAGKSEHAIEITTIHKAKGLQRRAVILPCDWAMSPKIPYTMWVNSEHINKELHRFPVKYTQALQHTDLSEDWLREYIYNHVDNINLLYVALTRAEEALYIYTFQRDLKEAVSGHLLNAIEQLYTKDDHSTSFKNRSEGDKMHYTWGTLMPPVPKKQGNEPDKPHHNVLTDYPTERPTPTLRFPSQRYFEEEGTQSLAPRDMGILMHRIFEQVTRREEIDEAINRMVSDGILSPAEVALLQQHIHHVLTDPTVNEWFSGRWQEIRNEQRIILPQQAEAQAAKQSKKMRRRPDRVMISGNRAVVVDYKFGNPEKEYEEQIRDYADLLRQMGYTSVEGYLWYVRLGRVEKITG